MNEMHKIWGVIAVLLVLLGCGAFVISMTALKWDFHALSTVEYETVEYDFNEAFSDIKITADTAKVTFLPSEGEVTRVVCLENKKAPHSVSLKEGMLLVELDDQRKWYDHISINFKSPSITVYLPQNEYGILSVKSSTGEVEIPADFSFRKIDVTLSTGDVSCFASASEDVRIKTSTGDILLEGVNAASLRLSATTGRVTVQRCAITGEVSVDVSTGKTALSDLTCQSVKTTGSTGKVILTNTVATASFSIKRTTGDVEFERCDAPTITVETDTGDVRGTLLTGKHFDTDTDTGRVTVPKDEEGGSCRVRTSTGDIRLSIAD